jgi:hypothetical protein
MTKIGAYLRVQRDLKESIQTSFEKVSRAMVDVDALLKKYLDNIDYTNPRLIKRANQIDVANKILEVYSRHVKDYLSTYDLPDPTVSATLARGCFELQLLLLEVLSNETDFFDLLARANRAYTSFTEILIRIAEREGNQFGVSLFLQQLQDAAVVARRTEKLMRMKTKSEQKGSHYVFKDLAKKHGYLEEYEIEYQLLSFFIHPSLLNIMTTYSKDQTASENMRQKAKLAVDLRKQMIKSTASRVVVYFSDKLVLTINQLLKD